MKRSLDFTTYQRRTRTADGEVCRCAVCGKFGLYVGGEWAHHITVEDGVWVTFRGDVCSDLPVAKERIAEEEHPASCGGTYVGIGFVDAAQQRHRARCTNHGNRLVETTVRYGPYKYVTELDHEGGETKMTHHIDGVCDNCGGPVMVTKEVLCYFCRHPRSGGKMGSLDALAGRGERRIGQFIAKRAWNLAHARADECLTQPFSPAAMGARLRRSELSSSQTPPAPIARSLNEKRPPVRQETEGGKAE